MGQTLGQGALWAGSSQGRSSHTESATSWYEQADVGRRPHDKVLAPRISPLAHKSEKRVALG